VLLLNNETVHTANHFDLYHQSKCTLLTIEPSPFACQVMLSYVEVVSSNILL